MEYQNIIRELRAHASPKNVEGMARFGISAKNTLGIPVPILRKLAKKIGRDHKLALRLWDSGIHEARLLAGFIDDHELVTSAQMDGWVADFDSWDICDQVCMNLFDKTPFAYSKITKWARDKREYVRRAAFAMMASLAVHDKKAEDKEFIKFLPMIKKYSTDERNFVRKAVNWALRQIGKRNNKLNVEALKTARTILNEDSKTARWIANDAIRELTCKAVQRKVRGGIKT